MPHNKIIRLRPKADEDLVNIYKYSYQEFGSARADQYMRDLDAAFHKLANEPGLGSDSSHVRPGLMVYRVGLQGSFTRGFLQTIGVWDNYSQGAT